MDTSPEIFAVAFTVRVLDTKSWPENLPSISAYVASMFPFMNPSIPIITLPKVFKVPSKVPSTLKSPSD